MIDPAKLTEENGFVDGCVVEIVWIDNRDWENIRYFHPEDVGHDGFFRSSTCEDIESIRPLTGPMAIWNFAPEDSSVLVQNSNGWFWMNHEPDCLAQSDIVTRRPFWAGSEK